MNKKPGIFTRFAGAVSTGAGSPIASLLAFALVVVWAVLGPLFGFSETWQLVINTGTTIITFLMVFVIQSSQNRDTKIVQLKLDALIHAMSGAKDKLMDLENVSDKDLESVHASFQHLAQGAKDEIDDRAAKKPKPKSTRTKRSGVKT
ncbi:low affinity iron permease family protein [Asticcacaulis biprosthecium]|nr:low affinity iron permease family protein [Asticcacaulis biprosthecium]